MTLIHRKAKPDDVDAIVELAVESVKRNALPVQLDPKAMREMAMFALNPAHFQWVTEKDGVVVAALSAIAQKSFWYRGLQASALLLYSREPNAGVYLVREFARWLKSRSGIKLAIIETEPGSDPRYLNILKRVGFSRESTNLCYVRNPE